MRERKEEREAEKGRRGQRRVGGTNSGREGWRDKQWKRKEERRKGGEKERRREGESGG